MPIKIVVTWCSKAVLAALLFLLVLPAIHRGADVAEARMRRDVLTLVTETGRHRIEIEVAESFEEKAVGLMFRKSIADNAGMLFPYAPPQELTMWMKNTLIPLDMVFIRGDGVVHRIEARTTPLSEAIISSNGEVAAVLELGGGVAAKLGLKPGDRVEHAYFKTRQK